MHIQRFLCFCKSILLATFTIMTLGFATSALANVYTVTDPGDSSAASVCDGTAVCTLRQAIMDANSNPGYNVIQFNINNHSPGPFSIKVSASLGPLPIIRNPVTIDGFTQAGSGVHAIELSGELLPVCQTAGCPNDSILPPTASSSGYAAGLLFVGRDRALGSSATDGPCADSSTSPGCKLAQSPDGSMIRGLVINKFPRQGIYLYGVDNITIVGNYFGLDTGGNLAGYQNGRLFFATTGISPPHDSIRIEASNNNFIGTTQADFANNTIQSVNRNVFGSAYRVAISMAPLNENIRGFAGCNPTICTQNQFGYSNNVVQGNYFGTDASGSCLIGGIGTIVNAHYAPLLCSNNPASPLGSQIFAIFLAGAEGIDLGKNNVIGGLQPGQGNVFDASNNNVISINGGLNLKILGNILGRDATGTRDLLTAYNAAALAVANTTNIVVNGNIVAASTFNGNANTVAVNFNAFGSQGSVVNNNVSMVNNQIIDNFHNGVSLTALNGKLGFDVQNGQIIPMPNVIANNQGTGIFSQQIHFPTVVNPSPAAHVAMLYNSIYGNNTASAPGLLGIDLIQTIAPPTISKEGPNINVATNVNFGPNNLQNFPVFNATRSFINPALVQVWGSLDSAPNQTYLIEVFSNNKAVCLQLQVSPIASYKPSASCPTDAGYKTSFLQSQGQVFIGEAMVTTDATGHVNFNFPAKVGVPIGSIITGTATLMQPMPDGSLMPTNTSEFSQAEDLDRVGSANAYLHADGAAGNDNTTPGPCDDPLSVQSLDGECGFYSSN